MMLKMAPAPCPDHFKWSCDLFMCSKTDFGMFDNFPKKSLIWTSIKSKVML